MIVFANANMHLNKQKTNVECKERNCVYMNSHLKYLNIYVQYVSKEFLHKLKLQTCACKLIDKCDNVHYFL